MTPTPTEHTWPRPRLGDEPLFNTAEHAARWRKERIDVLEAVLTSVRQELANCERDGQRLSQLLAEEEDRTEALEAALRALVAGDPEEEEGESGVFSCIHCGERNVPRTADPFKAIHKPDCPWAKARALLKGEA